MQVVALLVFPSVNPTGRYRDQCLQPIILCFFTFIFFFRMKKRMSTLMHTHVALIILTACAVLDASCVIGQIIADILIMKGRTSFSFIY